MQAGFTMLEAGAVRANNSKSIILKNIADLLLGTAGWIFCGYGLAFGTTAAGFMGTDSTLLTPSARVSSLPSLLISPRTRSH